MLASRPKRLTARQIARAVARVSSVVITGRRYTVSYVDRMARSGHSRPVAGRPLIARAARWIVQRPTKAEAVGSTPAAGAVVGEGGKAASAGLRRRAGSLSRDLALVAQSAERLLGKQEVTGSSPVEGSLSTPSG